MWNRAGYIYCNILMTMDHVSFHCRFLQSPQLSSIPCTFREIDLTFYVCLFMTLATSGPGSSLHRNLHHHSSPSPRVRTREFSRPPTPSATKLAYSSSSFPFRRLADSPSPLMPWRFGLFARITAQCLSQFRLPTTTQAALDTGYSNIVPAFSLHFATRKSRSISSYRCWRAHCSNCLVTTACKRQLPGTLRGSSRFPL